MDVIPFASGRAGATRGEWRAALSSPLLPWLLPVACAPAPHVRDGAARQPGKIPSQYVTNGAWTGLVGWSKMPPATAQDVTRWANDPRLGYCVRLGCYPELSDGGPRLLAIDCDVDDPALADELLAKVEDALAAGAPLAIRQREGSPRWAALFRIADALPGEGMSKRVVTFGDKGNLEILGTGQQLVCAGRHPSGASYSWPQGFAFCECSLEQFDRAINSLGGEIKTNKTKERPKGESVKSADPLAVFLRDRGFVLSEKTDGALVIECPWKDEHSAGKDGDSSTIYFPAGHKGGDRGFKCLHSHCTEKNVGALIEWARGMGYSECEYPTHEDGGAPNRVDQFRNEKTGLIEVSPESLYLAIKDPEFTGIEFCFDTFSADIKAREKGEKWVPFRDTMITNTARRLQAKGFKPSGLSKEKVRDAIHEVAEENKTDLMVEWLNNNTPKWDGVERIKTFARDCLGVELTDYSRAWGEYLWTALWGRAYSPDGVKADIAPVLVGKQGCRKSTFAEKMAISPDWFVEISFENRDADTIRTLRETIVAEIPELAGMNRRDNEALKAFLSKTKDKWVKKYHEAAEIAARRCVFILTTNDHQFLTDPTGNRRFAPIEIPEKIDIEYLEQNQLQLLAEARALFARKGVMQRELEAVSAEAIAAQVSADPWQEKIEDYLNEYGEWVGFEYEPTTENILKFILGFCDKELTQALKMRLGRVLRAMGLDLDKRQKNGSRKKIWFKK